MYERIKSIFEDNSFPPVLLLNGPWGGGKTYYVKKVLSPKLKIDFEDYDVFYISLYGITSVSDLRDKIIASLFVDADKVTTKIGGSLVSVVDGILQHNGVKGASALISGLSGAYKYSLYNGLDKAIIIFDDLERIQNTLLISQILGEILNLSEAKDIKSVVVANDDKIETKDDLEKVFADIIPFSIADDNIVELFSKDNEVLSDENLKRIIVRAVNRLGLKNVRVLKRALKRFLVIDERISTISNLDIAASRSILITSIIEICYALNECKLDYKELYEFDVPYLPTDDISKLNKFECEISRIFGDYPKLESKLVEFCYTGVYSFHDVVNELKLPVLTESSERLIFPYLVCGMTDDEFQGEVISALSLLKDKDKFSIFRWFSLVDALLFYVENKAIPSKVCTSEELLELIKGVSCEYFKKFTCDDVQNAKYSNMNFYSEDAQEMFDYLTSIMIADYSKSDWEKLELKMSTSWLSVYDECTSLYYEKPFFHVIDSSKFIGYMQKWSNEDLMYFKAFLEARYKYFIEQKFVKDEIPFLKKLNSEIKRHIDSGESLSRFYFLQIKNLIEDKLTLVGNID